MPEAIQTDILVSTSNVDTDFILSGKTRSNVFVSGSHL